MTRALVLLIALLAATPVAAQQASAEWTPLSLAFPRNDAPYPVRRHFVVSNERRHDLFLQAVRDKGGGYVGVGADQNYTLIAAARSEAAWILDIDEDVIAWHEIYAVLLRETRDRDDFLGALSGTRNAQVRGWIEAEWKVPKRTRMWRVFLRDRPVVSRRLVAERRDLPEAVGKAPPGSNWLSNEGYFAYIRKLAIEEKIVPRVGNIHEKNGAFLDVGRVTRAWNIPVQVLYLSNAEQWAPYTPAFCNSVTWMHRGQKAVVLRTLARPDLPAAPGDRWHYSAQFLVLFIQHLGGSPPISRVQDLVPLMRQAPWTGFPGLSSPG